MESQKIIPHEIVRFGHTLRKKLNFSTLKNWGNSTVGRGGRFPTNMAGGTNRRGRGFLGGTGIKMPATDSRSTLGAAKRFHSNVTSAQSPVSRNSFLRGDGSNPMPYPTVAQKRSTRGSIRQANKRGIGY